MENKLSNNLMSKILPYTGINSPSSLDDKYVIVTKEGLYSPSNGIVFHETEKQAWKHWYNDNHWIVKREYKKDYAESQGVDSHKYWTLKIPVSETKVWQYFKNTMVEDYGFTITQWKNAKRNVCGESRTEGEN